MNNIKYGDIFYAKNNNCEGNLVFVLENSNNNNNNRILVALISTQVEYANDYDIKLIYNNKNKADKTWELDEPAMVEIWNFGFVHIKCLKYFVRNSKNDLYGRFYDEMLSTQDLHHSQRLIKRGGIIGKEVNSYQDVRNNFMNNERLKMKKLIHC